MSVRVLKSTVWILGAVSLLGSVKDEEKQCGITLQVLTQTGAVPKAALGGAAWPRLLSSLFNVLRIQSHQPSYSCNTHFLFFLFFKPCGVASILWRVWFLPIWSECVPLTFLHCFHWLEQIQQGRKRGLKRQATVFLCYRTELYILTEQYSAFMPCHEAQRYQTGPRSVANTMPGYLLI